MISLSALSILIYFAIAMATAIPIILTVMLIKDWKRGKLW